jgi:hypothetical protein
VGDTRVGREGDAHVAPKRGTGSKEPEREPEVGNKRGRPPERPADISISPEAAAQPESPAALQSSADYQTAAEQPHSRNIGTPRRAPAKIRIPADLDLGEEMLTFGNERGWDRARCEGEFEQFKAYYADNGKLSADWSAGWRNWVLRGLRFDERERQRAQSDRATGPTAMVDSLLAHAAGIAREGFQ